LFDKSFCQVFRSKVSAIWPCDGAALEPDGCEKHRIKGQLPRVLRVVACIRSVRPYLASSRYRCSTGERVSLSCVANQIMFSIPNRQINSPNDSAQMQASESASS